MGLPLFAAWSSNSAPNVQLLPHQRSMANVPWKGDFLLVNNVFRTVHEATPDVVNCADNRVWMTGALVPRSQPVADLRAFFFLMFMNKPTAANS